jgi:glutamate-ammonia-ligase adenylyltransferase
LTLLAEVCLAYAVEKSMQRTADKYGENKVRFAVLALGKFAGRELGYGSDLDLVFVYETGGQAETFSLVEYFSAVASGIIRTLKEPTQYGQLYDVDARLRPDGNKGSLVVSDARLREYYAREAQAWERLALVKVRAVGGDPDFAARIEAQARELAFSLPLTREHLERIEEIRAKLAESSSPLSLKRSEGGLAELEFAIRLLQIAHAQRHPEVVHGDVLGALRALESAAILDARDAATLREEYGLFRRIENRLRIRQGRSTSTLPESEQEQRWLAERIGVLGDLASMVNEHKAAVHEIYRSVLKHVGSGG